MPNYCLIFWGGVGLLAVWGILLSIFHFGPRPSLLGLRQTNGENERTNASSRVKNVERHQILNPRAERAVQSFEGDVAEPLSGRIKAQKVITNAVECVQFISQLLDDLPVERGNTRRQLEALRRKLFIDDWRMAALYDPLLDADKSETAFARVLEAEGTVDIATLFQTCQRTGKSEAILGVADLTQHYQTLIASRNPGYQRLIEILDAYTSFPSEFLHSDLLKDAALYAAERTQILDWWAEEENDLSHLASQSAQAMAKNQTAISPEAVSIADSFFSLATSGLQDTMKSQLEANDRVFQWRFQRKYGLNAEALLTDLATVRLSGVSARDLSIPKP
jgi:hypothetical protein